MAFLCERCVNFEFWHGRVSELGHHCTKLAPHSQQIRSSYLIRCVRDTMRDTEYLLS